MGSGVGVAAAGIAAEYAMISKMRRADLNPGDSSVSAGCPESVWSDVGRSRRKVRGLWGGRILGVTQGKQVRGPIPNVSHVLFAGSIAVQKY